MSFLRMLAERTIGARPSLMPRLPSRFETPQIDFNPPAEIGVAPVAAPAAPAPPEPAIDEEVAPAPPPEDPIARKAVEPAPTARPRPPAPAYRPPPDIDREPGTAERARSNDDGGDAAPPPPRSAVAAHIAAEAERSERHAIRAAEPPPLRLLPLRPAAPPLQPSPTRGNRSAVADRQDRDDGAEAPSVRIHIGRIEVRAVTETKPPAPRPSPAPSRLDVYLKGRNGGRR
jgi:hypothetical protein